MAKFKRIAWLIAFFQRNRSFEFEWDQGNEAKSLTKHGITTDQAESTFYDPELSCLGIQINHNFTEDRFGIVAADFLGNVLFVSFTIRKGKIRVVSVRLANSRERKDYEF